MVYGNHRTSGNDVSVHATPISFCLFIIIVVHSSWNSPSVQSPVIRNWHEPFQKGFNHRITIFIEKFLQR